MNSNFILDDIKRNNVNSFNLNLQKEKSFVKKVKNIFTYYSINFKSFEPIILNLENSKIIKSENKKKSDHEIKQKNIETFIKLHSKELTECFELGTIEIDNLVDQGINFFGIYTNKIREKYRLLNLSFISKILDIDPVDIFNLPNISDELQWKEDILEIKNLYKKNTDIKNDPFLKLIYFCAGLLTQANLRQCPVFIDGISMLLPCFIAEKNNRHSTSNIYFSQQIPNSYIFQKAKSFLNIDIFQDNFYQENSSISLFLLFIQIKKILYSK